MILLRGSARGERGAVALEYAGLLVVAALVFGALYAVGIPAKAKVSVSAAVCHVLGGAHCEKASGTKTAAGKDRGGSGGEKQEKKKEKKKSGGGGCHGLLGCTWSATRHAAGGAWDAAKDTGSDIKSTVTSNPVKTIWHAGTYVWDRTAKPWYDAATKCPHGLSADCQAAVGCAMSGSACLLGDTIFDDKVKDDFTHHRWGDLSGRLAWNIGTFFLPTKIPGLNKAGKAAKGAGDAGKAAKVAKSAQEAEKAAGRAEDLAGKGDQAGARKAAGEAKRKADEAESEARKHGCKVAALGLHLGRYGAALPARCSHSQSAKAQQARDAADRANEAVERGPRQKKIDQAMKRDRFEDADHGIDDLRRTAAAAEARAKARPTRENTDAARKARRAADESFSRVRDRKIADSLKSEGKEVRLEGEVGRELRGQLVNFQKKFGPKGKLGELDVETHKAIVEVKSGEKGRSVGQVEKQQTNRTINPTGKPVLVYAPNMKPGALRNLERQTGAKCYRNMDDLKQALRDLGESIP